MELSAELRRILAQYRVPATTIDAIEAGAATLDTARLQKVEKLVALHDLQALASQMAEMLHSEPDDDREFYESLLRSLISLLPPEPPEPPAPSVAGHQPNAEPVSPTGGSEEQESWQKNFWADKPWKEKK